MVCCALYTIGGSHYFIPKAGIRSRRAKTQVDGPYRSRDRAYRAYSPRRAGASTDVRTLQGRLPKDLRLAGSGRGAANAWLKAHYIRA